MAIRMRRTRWAVALASLGLVAAPAMASENTTYTYDALGRLTGSASTGSVNNGLNTSITYDAAGNRSNYTVTGSANNSPPAGAVIVVPLAGYTIIPIMSSY
jgi:hypothetical protein